MLVLVDTNIWVQHFRATIPELVTHSHAGAVVTHSVIVGELAVGGLRNRLQTLPELRGLTSITECTTEATLDFLERHNLFNIGLSWGDVQILATANINGIPIWTLDQRLHQRAYALNLSWIP